MLVHTAVPKMWKDSIDLVENSSFSIVGAPPEKRRKMREYSNSELSSKHHHVTMKTPPTVLNQERRSTRRVSVHSSSSLQELVDEEESQNEDQPEETYQIESVTPMKSSNNITYEDIMLRPQSGKKVQYIFVKPKVKPAEQIAKMSTAVIRQRQPRLKLEEVEVDEAQFEHVPFVEDENISSSNIETIEEKHIESAVPEHPKDNESLENYSEFIFNGEKYVQMPKRIFEAEKEKLKQETERLKSLLRKLKVHLNKMDLD